MVSNTTPLPRPLPATHCQYILYFDTGKGKRGERLTIEKVSGATAHKDGSKIPT